MKADFSKTHYRLLLVLVWTAVLYAGYIATNRFYIFQPVYLPMTAFDRAIPFLPWTVIPYLVLISGIYLFAFINHRQDFCHALLALTLAVTINYSIYLLYPTIFQRPATPTDPGLVYDLYRWLVSIDTPANCFPSGHVTTPAIGCWYFLQHNKQLRWPLLLVFILLCLTTLTTKQHYAIDIIAGLSTAAIGITLSEYLMHRRMITLGFIDKRWNTQNDKN